MLTQREAMNLPFFSQTQARTWLAKLQQRSKMKSTHCASNWKPRTYSCAPHSELRTRPQVTRGAIYANWPMRPSEFPKRAARTASPCVAKDAKRTRNDVSDGLRALQAGGNLDAFTGAQLRALNLGGAIRTAKTDSQMRLPIIGISAGDGLPSLPGGQ